MSGTLNDTDLYTGGNIIVRFAPVANSVNNVVVTPSVTGAPSNVTFTAESATDNNVSINFLAKRAATTTGLEAGSLALGTTQFPNVFNIYSDNNAVNGLNFSAAGTGNGPRILPTATDGGNVPLVISARGNADLFLTSVYGRTTASASNLVVQTNGAIQRSTSSMRYKTDIRPMQEGLKEVQAISPVSFAGMNDDRRHGGLLAEDLHANGLDLFVLQDDKGRPDAIEYPYLTALLVNAIKQLAERVEGLEKSLNPVKTEPQT